MRKISLILVLAALPALAQWNDNQVQVFPPYGPAVEVVASFVQSDIGWINVVLTSANGGTALQRQINVGPQTGAPGPNGISQNTVVEEDIVTVPATGMTLLTNGTGTGTVLTAVGLNPDGSIGVAIYTFSDGFAASTLTSPILSQSANGSLAQFESFIANIKATNGIRQYAAWIGTLTPAGFVSQ